MTNRNLSVNRYYQLRGQGLRPRYRFQGETKQQWQEWRDALRPKVVATLGTMPDRTTPLNPEVVAEWEEDGLVKQKVLIDVEPDLSAAALIFRPAKARGRLPAILVCHGHGEFGKNASMGLRYSPEIIRSIEALNYDYGLQMAKAGFVTIAIDWRGFGERNDTRRPHSWGGLANRDLCNLHYLRSTMLGQTVLGENVHDAQRTLDYLCGLDFVDPGRIGVMGLSFGGTMTTWISLIEDQRIKATDIICYSDRFADFAMRDTNVCGSQITPGLFDLCDVPDLQGLIAPRPLLVEIGAQDDCFLIESAMSCFREVEKIYTAAGAREKLELDLYEGGHRWGANKSVEFFRKSLG